MTSEHHDSVTDATLATRPAKPAIVYMRFSPKPDHAVSVDTIDSQRVICARYCAAHALTPAVFIEDELVSARCTPLLERPNGRRLTDLIAGGIRDVVAVRLDRVFRDTIDGLTTFANWHSDNVSLHLADQGGCSINCGTPTGKLIATMLLGVASYEPEITAERTRTMMLHKQAKGQRMTSSKTLPWGWRLDENSELNSRGQPTKMVPDDEERRLAGIVKTSLLHRTPTLTADYMNRVMLSSCRGKPWDHRNVVRVAQAAEKFQ